MKKTLALLLSACLLCAFVVVPVAKAQDNGISLCGIFDEEDEWYDGIPLA